MFFTVLWWFWWNIIEFKFQMNILNECSFFKSLIQSKDKFVLLHNLSFATKTLLVNRLKLGYNLWKICSLVISVIIRQTWDQNIRLSCFPFLINFITADCFNFLKQYWSYNVKEKQHHYFPGFFSKQLSLKTFLDLKRWKWMKSKYWLYWEVLSEIYIRRSLIFLVGGGGYFNEAGSNSTQTIILF